MAAPAPDTATAAAAALTPTSSKKQKRSEKAAAAAVGGSSAKKSRAAAAPAKKTQSNTLDSWFKKAAAPPKAYVSAPEAPAKRASSAAEGDPTSVDDELAAASTTSAVVAATASNSNGNGSGNSASQPAAAAAIETPEKKRTTSAASSSAKKLVQRRIHINDPCRVCDAARTEESSRCELRCLGCDMTVHKSCYGVESDEPIDDWRCRRCEFVLDRKNELLRGDEGEGGDGDAAMADASDESAPPAHAPLESTHRHHALHVESDFATVFQFLKRFRRMGLKVSMDATLTNLADALVNATPTKFLEELHVRLLLNVEATISKNHDWTVSLARFLADSRLAARSAPLAAFITAGAPSSKSVGETAGLYAALDASDRVAVLKHLCETQFDDNDALVERIGDQEGDSLRDEPAGADASGRAYWAIEDAPSVLDGTAWICRSAGPTPEHADGVWETVSDDLASLEALVAWLSLSRETAELQLWQRLSAGVLKSLERRSKKQQQSAARLARMPHLLGGLSGLSLGVLAAADDGLGVRRSSRNRRAVSYRIASEDEDDDEDEDMDEEEEEEEDEDEDDRNASDASDEGDGADAKRRSTRAATSHRTRADAEPSRRSSRLRGGPSSAAGSAIAASPPPSSPSPVRRGGGAGRRVATCSSLSSTRRQRRRSAAGSSSSSSSDERQESHKSSSSEAEDDGDDA